MTSRVWTWIIVIALLGGSGSNQADAQRTKYKESDVQDAGTIMGVLRFEGKVPKRKTLKVTIQDKACHHEPILSEDLVVSEKGGVQWAVASIKKITSGKPFPQQDSEDFVQLDQKGCVFVPHVVVIPTGGTLRILNSDGILHNVHITPRKNKSLNKAMPGKVKKMDVSFKRAETMRVTCDVHNWMKAWIVVAKHPYHAVTDQDGAFRMDDVPAGTYTVEIWHEKLGKQKKQVTVKSGEETEVVFSLKKK